MEHSVLNALISVVVVVIVIAVIFIFFLIVLVIEPETDVLVESYIEVVRGTTSNRYWYAVAVQVVRRGISSSLRELAYLLSNYK